MVGLDHTRSLETTKQWESEKILSGDRLVRKFNYGIQFIAFVQLFDCNVH